MLNSGHRAAPSFTAILVASLLCGCATAELSNPLTAEEMRKPSGDYEISAGDLLDVKLYYRPELNERTPVRPDGKISLQLIGEMQAEGVTAADLSREIEERYSGHVQKPATTVIVKTFEGQIAFIDGEVGRPGAVRFHRTPSLYEAVVLAGGLQRTAARSIKLIRNRGNERPAVAVIEVSQLIQTPDGPEPVYLRPYDVVYVPKSFITRVNDFIDQYIDEVIPNAAQRMLGVSRWWIEGDTVVTIPSP